MQITTGCDLVQISKFSKALQERHFILEKLFTTNEQKNIEPEHLAGIFAAKEALIKALGKKAGRWHKLEITYSVDGAPQVVIRDDAWSQEVREISISISHDGDYALATAVAVLR